MRKTTLTTSVVGWASIVLMLFSSCSPALTARTKVKKSVLMSESARMIDEYYEEVRTVLVENGEYSEEEIASYGTLTGRRLHVPYPRRRTEGNILIFSMPRTMQPKRRISSRRHPSSSPMRIWLR